MNTARAWTLLVKAYLKSSCVNPSVWMICFCIYIKEYLCFSWQILQQKLPFWVTARGTSSPASCTRCSWEGPQAGGKAITRSPLPSCLPVTDIERYTTSHDMGTIQPPLNRSNPLLEPSMPTAITTSSNILFPTVTSRAPSWKTGY